MKNIEHEYNKRFKEQEVDNTDFDVEGLWKDIIDDLDTPPAGPTNPTGSSPLKFWGYGAIIALLIGASYFFFTQPNNQIELADNSSKKETKPIQQTDNQPNKTKEQTNTSAQIIREAQTKQYDTNTQNQSTILNTNEKEIVTNSTQKATTYNPVINPKNKIVDQQANKMLAQKQNNLNQVGISQNNSLNQQPSNAASQQQPHAKENPIDKAIVNQHHTNEIDIPTNNSLNKKNNKVEHQKSNKIVDTTTKPNDPGQIDNTANNNLDTKIITSETIVDAPKTRAGNTIINNNSNSASNNLNTKIITSETEVDESKTNDNIVHQADKSESIVDASPDKINDKAPSTDVIPNDPITAESQLEDDVENIAKRSDKKIKTLDLSDFSWKVGINGGANKMFMDFGATQDAELAALRKQNDKGQWGQSYALDVSLLWKSKLFVNTGIGYQINTSQFIYSQQKPITKTFDSVLQVVVIDTAGNILTTTYGSKTITDTIKSQLVSDNEYKSYRIPLELGFQVQKNRWLYGLKVGALFSFTTLQTGKTFNEEKTVAAFSKTSSFAPFKSFQVGFRATPFVGYRITKHLTARVEPRWSWFTGHTTRAQEFGVNVGLGLSF